LSYVIHFPICYDFDLNTSSTAFAPALTPSLREKSNSARCSAHIVRSDIVGKAVGSVEGGIGGIAEERGTGRAPTRLDVRIGFNDNRV
jgi:hypothetical protein